MRPATILLVEDNQHVLRALCARLEHAGWTVEACEDGSAALAKIESDARYDLLLLDHDLPGANGSEIIARARRLPHRRHTPIILCSGDMFREEALAAGADAFLRKPEEISELVATVKRLLNQAAPAS